MESNLAAAFLLATTPVTDMTTLTVDTYCVDTVSLYNIIQNYEEKPMLTGVSYRMAGNKEIPLALVLYVNPETKSWSLVEKVKEDFYCVIGMGDNIKPYTK